MTNSYDSMRGDEEDISQNARNITDQVDTSNIQVYRPGVPSNTEMGNTVKDMHRTNDILSAAQTQYENDRNIKTFRKGIKNPPYGFGR